MSRKHKKTCEILSFIEHFLYLASTITGCTSVSAFAALIGVSVEIMGTAIGIKICAIAAGTKMFELIIKKKHDEAIYLTKSELNKMEALISKALIDSVISNAEFVLIKNVLKQYDEMEEEIKNLRT